MWCYLLNVTERDPEFLTPYVFFFKCAVSLGHGLLTRNVLIFFVRPVCTFVISWQTTGLCEKLNVSMDLKRSSIRGLNISSYDL